MTGIELYRTIGTWITRYHDRQFRQTGLIKDWHHDLWLLLSDKNETTLSYIKQHCWLYPKNAIRYKYYKKQADFTAREVVLLDDEHQPITEFPDNSFNPEYEFPLPPAKKRKKHKDTRGIRVLYRNGMEEEFDSVVAFAEVLGVHRNSVQRVVGRPLSERYTKRKMSHIKLISYAD